LSLVFDIDLRWVTAICYGVVGLSFVALAVWVWWMPLHRRAVLFEPYLTPRGVELMLGAWPLVFVVGAFMIVSGASRLAYFMHSGRVLDSFTLGIGMLEAIFSFWAAGSVTVVAARAWRKG
jgi:hypothetical protein